jgi:HAE1 family hydrophobic/amphiphilic exporter-1
MTSKALMRKLNQEFAAMPEAQVVAFGPPAIPGIGNAGGFSVMVQDKAGSTPEELGNITQTFIEAAKKRPEIGSAFTLYTAQVPQVFLNVDRDKVMKQGVDPGELYGALQAYLGGMYVGDFNRFGRQWKVYISGEPEYRQRAEEVENFFVRNRSNQMVPLSTLTTPRPAAGPDYTNRFNLMRAAEVTGTPAPGFSSGDALAALEAVAKEVLPAEYGISFANLSFQEKRAPSPVPTFVMAILFVFLILAAQYESWALPFSVLLVVPAALVGSFLGLLSSHRPFDVFGQIGLVMLVGLSAKNAILIVEFAKAEHEKGKSLVDAALEAARLRLRPILMTAFAFILGCVPLLRASGAGAQARHSMGTVVVYGSLTATFLGIFLTPALFVMAEKLSSKSKKKSTPDDEPTPLAPAEVVG